MVEMQGETVCAIEVKPLTTGLQLTWLVAVWGAAFTAFLHEWVAAGAEDGAPSHRELYMSDALLAAISAGMTVAGLEVPGGGYADFGVPGHGDLARRLRHGATDREMTVSELVSR